MQVFSEKQKDQNGYIALISTIVISLILVGLTSLLSSGGYFTRASAANGEYKRISLGLAEACVNDALLRLAQNYNYTLDSDSRYDAVRNAVEVQVGTDAQGQPEYCYVTSVGSPATQRIIATQASFQGAFSSMSITATVQDPSVVYTPPTTLIVYASGDLPSEFHLSINGEEVASGEQKTLSAGNYIVSETHNGDYVVLFGGDCDAGGNVFLVAGESHACNIYYEEQENTANLTVVANIFPSGGVSDLQVINNSTGDISTGTSPSMVKQVPADVSYTVSATTPDGYQTSEWSGACDPNTGITGTLVAGTNYTCVINFSQPAPACADTVMMLDRSLSMFGWPDYPSGYQQWIPDEKNAAKSLINLYDNINPHPKVSIGRFGDVSSGVNAEIINNAHLTNDYTNLPSIIDNGLPENPTGYTNLSDAINKSETEFNNNGSYNPDGSPFQHVLILVSDGGPNRPGCSGGDPCAAAENAAISAANTAKQAGTQIYTIHFGDAAGQDFLASLANDSAVDHFLNADTGFSSPSRNIRNAYGDDWSNPTGAYANGGTVASDNEGERHRYYNFNFDIPSNSTINGIEIKADAWASGSTVDTGYKNPSAQTSDTGGDDDGFELNPTNAFTDGGAYASNFNGTADRHRFYGYNFGLPSGATITGIEVRLDWWLDRTSGTNSMSVELSWDGGTSWTSTQTSTHESTSPSNTDTVGGSAYTWGRSWSVTDFNNFRVRITSNCSGSSSCSDRDFYLDWIPVKVYYTPPSSGCQLGVDLSWDGGNNNSWSSEKTQNLTASEINYTFGGDGEKWGTHNWQSSEFSNNNFYVRVHEIGSGCLAQLDWLQAKIHYSTVDVAAENADGDNFYISPTSEDMKGIFEDIGRAVCPAVGCATQAKMNVITQVVNSNGEVGQPSDFHITISGASASPDSFDGSEEVIVTPDTSFNIDVTTSLTNYYAPQYIGCSATNNSVAAGETAFCTIVNYDKPPDSTYIPPPPPPANIIINTWTEKP